MHTNKSLSNNQEQSQWITQQSKIISLLTRQMQFKNWYWVNKIHWALSAMAKSISLRKMKITLVGKTWSPRRVKTCSSGGDVPAVTCKIQVCAVHKQKRLDERHVDTAKWSRSSLKLQLGSYVRQCYYVIESSSGEEERKKNENTLHR